MGMKVSELYHKEIYTEDAEYLGRVEEVVLNVKDGEVMLLCLESLRNKELTEERRKEILRESLRYSDVLKVKDIVICKRRKPTE